MKTLISGIGNSLIVVSGVLAIGRSFTGTLKTVAFSMQSLGTPIAGFFYPHLQFDIILVETVGVGQSEFKVKDMVDCFFLLLSPGGGDELQGIKKGIVEIADIMSINKCDGDLEQTALYTRKEYSQALHLFPAKANGWDPKVITTSSETGHGLEDAWQLMKDFLAHISSNGSIDKIRRTQDVLWFKERIAMSIHQYIQDKTETGDLARLQNDILSGSLSPLEAADAAVRDLLN